MGWMDKIIISQDTQATILKYAPIIGPIVGSAAIVALYLLARLIRVRACWLLLHAGAMLQFLKERMFTLWPKRSVSLFLFSEK